MKRGGKDTEKERTKAREGMVSKSKTMLMLCAMTQFLVQLRVCSGEGEFARNIHNLQYQNKGGECFVDYCISDGT